MTRTTHNLPERAQIVATAAHAGQFREAGKGETPEPYIEHPKRVVEILERYGVTDQNILAVGWLHDVAEDTQVRLDAIRSEFGEHIRWGVALLTHDDRLGHFERKADAVKRLRDCWEDPFAQVKLADRLVNLSEMTSWKPRRRFGYAQDALGVLWAVPRHMNPRLWDALYGKAVEVLDAALADREEVNA